MKNETYDVILVGGGVMGCATAYYLLKLDNRIKIAIVEKDPTYAKASTTLSDGNIRIQFNLKENIQMSQYGLQVLDRFAEEMAVGDTVPDVAFRRQGDLFLFDENGREAAEQGYALQKSLGCEVQWLAPNEIEGRFPLLNLASCAGGTLGRNEGTMDPHAVLQAYKNKAIALGATYIQAAVESVIKNGTKISGVKLSSGETVTAGIVVNSAGPWVPELARTVGIELPIEPIKRQVFVLETNSNPQGMMPLTVFPSGLYLIQEHGRHFLCGKSFADDPTGTDDFSWSRQRFVDKLWPELVEYVPAFDRLKIVSGWSGLYAVNTLDGNAILGEWPGLRGFYLIGGFSGHGFQQCFAVGRYIAELILVRPPTLDLSIFSPQRIIENRPVFESKSRLV